MSNRAPIFDVAQSIAQVYLIAELFICADVCTAYWPVAREDGDDVLYADADESPDAQSGFGSKELSQVRVEFPETWLWSESSTGYHVMPALVCFL